MFLLANTLPIPHTTFIVFSADQTLFEFGSKTATSAAVMGAQISNVLNLIENTYIGVLFNFRDL